MDRVATRSMICEIWSHSHAPPLRPAAALAFDLRRTPNPPKHIRDRYDGRSKRLREHLLHEAVFTEMLESAIEEISQAAEKLCAESDVLAGGAQAVATSNIQVSSHAISHAERRLSGVVPADSSTIGRTTGPECSDSGRFGVPELMDRRGSRTEHACCCQPEVLCNGNHQCKEDPLKESGEDEPEESFANRPKSDPVLRISCFCERGRHRSVAFAEEVGMRLARMHQVGGVAAAGNGRVQMEVSVQHRDVDVTARSRTSGRVGRGQSRVVGASMTADQEES